MLKKTPQIIQDLEALAREKKLLCCADLIRVGLVSTPNALWGWRRYNFGPICIKLGGKYRYPSDMVLEWVKSKFCEQQKQNARTQRKEPRVQP